MECSDSMTSAKVKQVKVDNWGIFFLQRVQQLFIRSEFCDLVLQFSNNEQLRVHRLVLNACTDYFQILEKVQFVGNSGDVLTIPNDLESEVVVPIINFMYTGKLEFKEELQTKLYNTSKIMKMTILTKLLDAQVSSSNAANPQKPIQSYKKNPAPLTWNLQGKKIIPRQVDPDLPEPLPGRKLPIWKRKSAPTTLSSFFSDSFKNHEGSKSSLGSGRTDDAPKPTRFEWPEDDNCTSFDSSFDDLSYETKPLMKPTTPLKQVTASPSVQASLPSSSASSTPASAAHSKSETKQVTFEDIKRTAMPIKRPLISPDDSSNKKSKVLDLQAVKEYVEEHRLRNELAMDPEENSETVDDDLAVADFDDDDDDLDDEEMSASGVLVGPPPPVTPQKSILKPPGSNDEVPSSAPTPSSTKKVRFSLDGAAEETKENETKELQTVVSTPSRIPGNLSEASTASTGNLSNHAKIISEVLKKYPHLVKNNKNIKLKIMQRGNQSSVVQNITAEGDSKAVKSKVSYVVVKSDTSGKGNPAVVLKHGGHVQPLSELGTQKPTGAENTTGPWLCHSCGSNDQPMNFETYYLYRRHLQDVHNEKIDARICEHCGHRASKRNLLLYHLYTRHNIPPPRNCQFPKCDQCDYVALSESLLIKHRNNHINNKEFVCKVCFATFKSNGALQGHMQTNLHSDPAKKVYECPFCLKPFVRNINLKAHIRTSHKELERKFEAENQNQILASNIHLNLQDCDDSQEDVLDRTASVNENVIENDLVDVPVISAMRRKPRTNTMVLPSNMAVLTEPPSVQNLVSSEAEALSNVASGIAASLGLTDATFSTEQTVILLDENQSLILQSTDVAGEETTRTEVQEYMEESAVHSETQEYIVPEIMGDEQQMYTAQLPVIHRFNRTELQDKVITNNTDGHALAPRQPVTSSATMVTLKEDMGMVIPDHDYAEDTTQQRPNCNEGMMFIITHPQQQTVILDRMTEQEMPTLKREEQITHQHIGGFYSEHSDTPPVLTREDGHAISHSQNIIEIPSENQPLHENSPLSVHQSMNRNSNKIVCQENITETNQHQVVILNTENVGDGDDVENITGSNSQNFYVPVSKAHLLIGSQQIKQMSSVQMADIVKDWDDDSSDENTQTQ